MTSVGKKKTKQNGFFCCCFFFVRLADLHLSLLLRFDEVGNNSSPSFFLKGLLGFFLFVIYIFNFLHFRCQVFPPRPPTCLFCTENLLISPSDFAGGGSWPANQNNALLLAVNMARAVKKIRGTRFFFLSISSFTWWHFFDEKKGKNSLASWDIPTKAFTRIAFSSQTWNDFSKLKDVDVYCYSEQKKKKKHIFPLQLQ